MKAKIRCPICKRVVPWKENPFRPFCSERCKLIDLGSWIGERYRILGEEEAQHQDHAYPEEEDSAARRAGRWNGDYH